MTCGTCKEWKKGKCRRFGAEMSSSSNCSLYSKKKKIFFNLHIGKPSRFTIGFQRNELTTRIYIGIFSWVWCGNFTLINYGEIDWTDDGELQEYLLKTKREFKDLTREEKRKYQWGWLEEG